MRPGRSVSVQVLANDSDPDGSPLDRHDGGAERPTGRPPDRRGRRIVTSRRPTSRATTAVIYTIQNESGGTSSSFITVDGRCRRAARATRSPSDTVLTRHRRARPRHGRRRRARQRVLRRRRPRASSASRSSPGYASSARGAAEQAHPGDDRRQEPDHPVLGVAPGRRRHPLATRSSGCPATTTRCRSSTARRRALEVNSEDDAARSTSTTTSSRSAATRCGSPTRARCARPTPTATTSSSTRTRSSSPRRTSTSVPPRSRSRSPTARRRPIRTGTPPS